MRGFGRTPFFHGDDLLLLPALIGLFHGACRHDFCLTARQEELRCFRQIFDDMEAIRYLNGLGSTLRSSRGIGASTIPADRLEIWVLAHPGGGGVRFPIS